MNKLHQRQPSYREAGRTYHADSCQALVAAAGAGMVRLAAMGRKGYPGRRLGRDQLPGLRSIGVWDAGPHQQWGLPMHRNEGIEITFVAGGHTPITIETSRRILHHDEFMITRPWQPHQIGNPFVPSCRLIWMILDVDVRRPHQTWNWPDWIVLSRDDLLFLTRCLRQNEQYIWPGSEEIRRCFTRIAHAVEQDQEGSSASRLAVLINEVLLALLDIFRQKNITLRHSLTSAHRTVELFLEELNASLADPWTLQSMAASCHMGTTQFVRHFRKFTNLSPVKYLNHARVRRACELLSAEIDRPITEIALACGFSSSQYFTNNFRKHLGCSPRQYRRRTAAGAD